MIKLFSKNSFKWWILIIFIATILVVVDLTLKQNPLKQESLNNEALASKPSNADTGPIDVPGDSTSVSLHSVNFIDENNGWAVEDEFQSDAKNSKILRTKDGGLQWDKIADTSFAVKKLYFVNKTTGWAAAEDSSNTAKILFTEDGGSSWSSQFENKTNQSLIYDMYFQDAASGYTLMGGRLFSTLDSGKHWSQVNFNIKGFEPQHMSFSNFNTGWVIGIIQGENKLIVLHTTDGGKNWSRQFEKNYADGPVGSVDIDFINSSTGWFLTSNLATWTGELYYTSDGGSNWEKINEVKCVRPTPKQLHFVTNKIGWIPLDVGAGPIAGGLLFTQDGGKSFSHIGGEDKMSSAKEVYFTSVNVGYAVFSDVNHGDYIMKTTDGGRTWNFK